ncbi:hypothetical protein AOLI_G00298990 [Acnodon oligacanthus]
MGVVQIPPGRRTRRRIKPPERPPLAPDRWVLQLCALLPEMSPLQPLTSSHQPVSITSSSRVLMPHRLKYPNPGKRARG